MFGTLGFSELIIILVIVLIIFGAGRLPQIGEGIGKALKGFKKEVNEPLPPLDPNAQQPATGQAPAEEAQTVQPQVSTPPPPKPTAPYQPGPELTPGTTAALMASAAPQRYEPPKPKGTLPPQTAAPSQPAPAQPDPMSMEQRAANPPPRPQAAYPPVPPAAQTKAPPKRPSAVVNKEAVARVQAQQAALKAKQNAPQGGPSPQDMQSLGEGIGDALRTFRQAVADVRGAVDPQMRTIQAEVDAAQKEIEQSIEAAKQMPQVQDDPPPKT